MFLFSLGALHDEYTSCPGSDSYLMSTQISENNLVNLYKFSPCSINQFKYSLLKFDRRSVSMLGKCLANNPTVDEEIKSLKIDNKLLPGQAFTADDQCKMIFGSTASFCHVKKRVY